MKQPSVQRWSPAGQSTSVRRVTPTHPFRAALCALVWLVLAAAPAAAAPRFPLPQQPPADVPVEALVPAPTPAVEPAPAAEDPQARRRAVREELAREQDQALGEDDVGMGAMLFRTFVVLGVVILSIYLTLNFGLRRLMGLKAPLGMTGVVTVVERVALDQRRALFVVKAGGEYLLVGGGGEGALSLLCKLSAEEVDRALREKSSGGLAMSPFLQKLLARRPPPS